MSLAATVWALKQRDVPLDARFVLVCLADRHCVDSGCVYEADLLAAEIGISRADLMALVGILERAGKLRHLDAAGRVLLGCAADLRASGGRDQL